MSLEHAPQHPREYAIGRDSDKPIDPPVPSEEGVADQDTHEEDPALREARARFAQFQERFERTINAYFGTPDIPFTMRPPGPGESGGWYIDLENVRVNADPTFFIERGYEESEALFATFHEAEHFRDMAQDPDAYRVLFERINAQTDVAPSYPAALGRLYNCLDDVLVNKAVMARWKAGVEAKNALYPKLFPSAALEVHPETGMSTPRHRQFMYALLRGAMLPDEELTLDEDVREAIDRVNTLGEGTGTLLDHLTGVDFNGRSLRGATERFVLIQSRIESAFRELYARDLEDRTAQPPSDEGGDTGSGGGDQAPGRSDETGTTAESHEPADPFGDDPFGGAVPDPVDFKDVLDELNKLRAALKEKRKQDFKDAMGVEKGDYEAYMRDYRQVDRYIERLADIFEDVIARRKTMRRRLRRSSKDGPLLDHRKAAIAVAEIQAGNSEPRVMLDYEPYETIDNVPSGIQFSLLCDGSGSMKEGEEGKVREQEQRKIAVLVMEAFAEFRRRIEEKKRAGDDLQLDVETEVRIFSDTDSVAKPMSDALTHVDRVAMRKKLMALPHEGTNEVSSLKNMQLEQCTGDVVARLQQGDLKKIVLILTDGESQNEGELRQEVRALEALGQSDRDRPTVVVAAIGFAGGRNVTTTYAPYGYYAEKMDDIPDIFVQFLREMLETV